MATIHVIFIFVFSLGKCQIRELILGDFPEFSTQKNVNDILYQLYTRANATSPINLKDSPSEFNKDLDVKVIIHGFTESLAATWYPQMTQAYLANRDLNVIAIDWSKRAKRPYTNAVKEAPIVGKAIGHFLIELQLQLSRTHIIGHSLGAHVAGFAGKHVYRATGSKIARITGLDPAGPLFEFPFIGDDERLTRTDANFVDVIHTDSGILGYKSAIGDADYFPNGGSAIQPGCKIPPLHDISEFGCSHKRSHQYFIESINSKKGVAKACHSWSSYQMGFCNRNDNALFGEWASPKFTGKFFLRTSASSPYFLDS